MISGSKYTPRPNSRCKRKPRQRFRSGALASSNLADRSACPATFCRWLESHFRMISAIGAGFTGFTAAEVEIFIERVADWPLAGAFAKLQQGQLAGNRYNNVRSWPYDPFSHRISHIFHLKRSCANGLGNGCSADGRCRLRAADTGIRLGCSRTWSSCNSINFLLRGAAVVVLPRPESFKRCTLPITALRLTPPSCAAIWLALKPSFHNFFSSSTRSSVQFIALGSNQFSLSGIHQCSRITPGTNTISIRVTRSVARNVVFALNRNYINERLHDKG